MNTTVSTLMAKIAEMGISAETEKCLCRVFSYMKYHLKGCYEFQPKGQKAQGLTASPQYI